MKAEIKRKKGRPKMKDKVQLAYVYLRKSEKTKIEGKHKTLTNALISVVLPQCG